VVLEMESHLSALTLTTTFSMPQGYQNAIVLTLAEDLAAPFRADATYVGQLTGKAAKARAVIFSNNRTPPNISTQDSGMPTCSGGSWNFRTGELI